MQYLLYQAYGNDEIAYEAIYSLLSLYKIFNGQLPATIQPVIYTDREDLFRKLLSEIPVKYHLLNDSIISDWKGEFNFVHRVKLKVLQDFSQHYNGSVLYMDTDTTFLQSPLPALEKIAAGQQMMHCTEYTLADNTYYAKKISKQVTKQPYNLPSGKQVSIPVNLQMWNAGAIGLPANATYLLEQVLQLTDELYKQYPAHVMEQLAFSYTLSQNGNIQPLDGYIYHYWNFKEYRKMLVQFFEHNKGKSPGELTSIISTINPAQLILPKLAYKQLPGWHRFLLKLVGKEWKLADYSPTGTNSA